MARDKTGVAIIGYSGMAGAELDLLLEKHPKAEIVYRERSNYIEGNLDEASVVFLVTKPEVSLKRVSELMSSRMVFSSHAINLTVCKFSTG